MLPVGRFRGWFLHTFGSFFFWVFLSPQELLFLCLTMSSPPLGAVDLRMKLASDPSRAWSTMLKKMVVWVGFWPPLSWLITPLSNRNIEVNEGKIGVKMWRGRAQELECVWLGGKSWKMFSQGKWFSSNIFYYLVEWKSFSSHLYFRLFGRMENILQDNVFPRFVTKTTWDNEILILVIKEILQKYNILFSTPYFSIRKKRKIKQDSTYNEGDENYRFTQLFSLNFWAKSS